jgi:hypothetical protein
LGGTAGALSSGCYNVALGAGAGISLTGSRNVVIGPEVSVPTPGVDGQLAIGFGASSVELWLTGNSSGSIKPNAGIEDCAGSCGTAGQVLMSNGTNAVCWGGGLTATCVIGGSTVVICNGLIISVT